MGQGDLDQLSMVIGRFEAGITALTEAVKDIGEKLTEVITAVHSHGERLSKVETVTDMLHEHHMGRTAIVGFLKVLPWAGIGSVAGAIAANWKSIVGTLLH